MTLSDKELNKIINTILPIFDKHISDYNEKKYCPISYNRFKKEYFKVNIINNEIQNSLEWKWGHKNKNDYPNNHKELIKEINLLWPKFSIVFCNFTPEETFQWWHSNLKRPTTYITRAFITHLIHSRDDIPLIDQHSFRGMNVLKKSIFPNYKYKKKPSNWGDILELKHFTQQLSQKMKVDLPTFDRFLMMYGKSQKIHVAAKGPRRVKIHC